MIQPRQFFDTPESRRLLAAAPALCESLGPTFTAWDFIKAACHHFGAVESFDCHDSLDALAAEGRIKLVEKGRPSLHDVYQVTGKTGE